MTAAFLAAVVFIDSPVALACSKQVLSLQTQFLSENVSLCSLQDRYQSALQRLQSKGIKEPERIAELHATRFINFPNWIQYRDGHHFDPTNIYQPAPKTWRSWEKAAAYLKVLTDKNARAQQIPPFDLTMMKEIFNRAMDGLSSIWRTDSVIGIAVFHVRAIDEQAAQTLRNFEYKSLIRPNEPLIKWHPTLCFEDRTSVFQNNYLKKIDQAVFKTSEWPDIPVDHYFQDESGEKKQCGFFEYSHADEVPLQMQKWFAMFNQGLKDINNGQGDPLLIAARFQRFFIAIHPYIDGNGRASRFAMDYVLRSLGLPSPIIRNFDSDVSTSEKAWAQELGRGLVMAVNAAEICAINPEINFCQPVPR
jgi:hypothetical protein